MWAGFDLGSSECKARTLTTTTAYDELKAELTDAIGREPEPVAEDAPALVAGVEGQESMEPILLLAAAAAAAKHLLLLVPETVGWCD